MNSDEKEIVAQAKRDGIVVRVYGQNSMVDRLPLGFKITDTVLAVIECKHSNEKIVIFENPSFVTITSSVDFDYF